MKNDLEESMVIHPHQKSIDPLYYNTSVEKSDWQLTMELMRKFGCRVSHGDTLRHAETLRCL